MMYAKLHACIHGHPKFLEAGPAAVGFWAASLSYSCAYELDGRIPRSLLGSILGLGPQKARALAERLVSVGLFERTDDGYRIAKFAKKPLGNAE